jgi:hypothetical protein
MALTGVAAASEPFEAMTASLHTSQTRSSALAATDQDIQDKIDGLQETIEQYTHALDREHRRQQHHDLAMDLLELHEDYASLTKKREQLAASQSELAQQMISAVESYVAVLEGGNETAPPRLVSSTPPSGSVNARQPADIDGYDVGTGWDTVVLEFDQNMEDLDETDLKISSAYRNGPAIAEILVNGPFVEIRFESALPIGQCTTIAHGPSATRVQVAQLPGDVNADGTTDLADLETLIDHLSGSLRAELPMWQCDINGSGACEPQDILRLVDLLNGAGKFDSWMGVSLDCK